MQGGEENQSTKQPNPDSAESGHINNQAVFSSNIESGSGAVSNSANLFSPGQEETLTWEASEYIHHEKGTGWYLILAGFLVVLVGAVYFLTRDIFASCALLIIGAAVGVFAGRKPKAISYGISQSEIRLGPKTYPLGEFKFFSINHSGDIVNAIFMPTKRFMPIISIYLPLEQSDKIIQILEKVLPREDYKPDLIEKFLERIRF